MSPSFGADAHHDFGFPRVSGDEPPLMSAPAKQTAFSPRERG